MQDQLKYTWGTGKDDTGHIGSVEKQLRQAGEQSLASGQGRGGASGM